MCFMLSQAVKRVILLLHLIFPNDEPNENCANVVFGLINCDDFTHSAPIWSMVDKNICHCGCRVIEFYHLLFDKKNRNGTLKWIAFTSFECNIHRSQVTFSPLWVSFPLISCSLCDCFSLLMCSHHFFFYHFRRRRYDLCEYEHKIPCATTQCTRNAHTDILARSLSIRYIVFILMKSIIFNFIRILQFIIYSSFVLRLCLCTLIFSGGHSTNCIYSLWVRSGVDVVWCVRASTIFEFQLYLNCRKKGIIK